MLVPRHLNINICSFVRPYDSGEVQCINKECFRCATGSHFNIRKSSLTRIQKLAGKGPNGHVSITGINNTANVGSTFSGTIVQRSYFFLQISEIKKTQKLRKSQESHNYKDRFHLHKSFRSTEIQKILKIFNQYSVHGIGTDQSKVKTVFDSE